eukprot:Pgem_evm2s752
MISIAEYSRKLGLPHPTVPTKEQFANPTNGLLNKTTFFGCFDKTAPTVVYIPHHIVTYATNFSTETFSYTDEEIMGFLQNGQSQIGGQLGYKDLPVCIGCLLTNFMNHVSEECNQCIEYGS